MANLKKTANATKYVYFFVGSKVDGNAEMRNLLGGKGADLAEMVNLVVIPVPPCSAITEECPFSSNGDKAVRFVPVSGLYKEIGQHHPDSTANRWRRLMEILKSIRKAIKKDPIANIGWENFKTFALFVFMMLLMYLAHKIAQILGADVLTIRRMNEIYDGLKLYGFIAVFGVQLILSLIKICIHTLDEMHVPKFIKKLMDLFKK